VVIVLDGGDDVQRYAASFRDLVFPRPALCPRCAAAGQLVGHGSYARTVTEPRQTHTIRIKRLLCTACRRTVSLLPTFCLPFRHYQTATIQAVLTLRCEAQASWATVGRRFLPADLPSRTSCREWVGAFTRTSRGYLAALLRQLATWAARSSGVELTLADVGTQVTTPAQLIAAVPHLLAGLRQAGLSVADGGRRWLATLWQWGKGMQLGRLV